MGTLITIVCTVEVLQGLSSLLRSTGIHVVLYPVYLYTFVNVGKSQKVRPDQGVFFKKLFKFDSRNLNSF